MFIQYTEGQKNMMAPKNIFIHGGPKNTMAQKTRWTHKIFLYTVGWAKKHDGPQKHDGLPSLTLRLPQQSPPLPSHTAPPPPQHKQVSRVTYATCNASLV